jgi:hypothetical protein
MIESGVYRYHRFPEDDHPQHQARRWRSRSGPFFVLVSGSRRRRVENYTAGGSLIEPFENPIRNS